MPNDARRVSANRFLPKNKRLLATAVMAATIASAGWVGSAFATTTTYTVTSMTDSGSTSATTTLSGTITQANSNTAAGNTSAIGIALPSGGTTIMQTSGTSPVEITEPVTISWSAAVTIDGALSSSNSAAPITFTFTGTGTNALRLANSSTSLSSGAYISAGALVLDGGTITGIADGTGAVVSGPVFAAGVFSVFGDRRRTV